MTEYRRLRLRRPSCAKTTLTELPAGIPTGAFGSRLQAAVVSLSAARLSRQQVGAIIGDCYGCPISAASVQAILAHAAAALEPAQSEIAAAISAAGVLNADETGWKVAGKGAQLWSATSTDAALYRIAPSRSQAEAKALLGRGFRWDRRHRSLCRLRIPRFPTSACSAFAYGSAPQA